MIDLRDFNCRVNQSIACCVGEGDTGIAEVVFERVVVLPHQAAETDEFRAFSLLY